MARGIGISSARRAVETFALKPSNALKASIARMWRKRGVGPRDGKGVLKVDGSRKRGSVVGILVHYTTLTVLPPFPFWDCIPVLGLVPLFFQMRSIEGFEGFKGFA